MRVPTMPDFAPSLTVSARLLRERGEYRAHMIANPLHESQ